ncbi:uncharacterized protein PITG_09589 [Phytophthora infestans T30-4]|uniref:Uncharacterized protein n=1 Tax=Phytophthora infestans (strain T30-4) TaxID=403677 RepID=D0NCC5_PHYIT|nr:uncharacterized protein PITG_09589 [Phytophthora infestans T30-4]EEY55639.1 conserved hypothetical protein [Phytophthora infestans T30-4]|eukprot:XP_002903215.1 conserved hypothetical protein [Phytophthora infestans T30-4]
MNVVWSKERESRCKWNVTWEPSGFDCGRHQGLLAPDSPDHVQASGICGERKTAITYGAFNHVSNRKHPLSVPENQIKCEAAAIVMHVKCAASLCRSSTGNVSSKTIADTIIVTHSMDGLMVAGALANDRCHDVRKLSTHHICAYISAQIAFRKHVGAVMCSDNYAGLFSRWQPVYQLTGSMISHKSKQTTVSSSSRVVLAVGLSDFSKSYVDPFYLMGLNHS